MILEKLTLYVPAMTKKTNEEDDNKLFRDAIGDIRKLNHDKITHEWPKPDHHPRQLIADEERVMQDILSDEYDSAELQPGDILNFHQGGLQRSVLRKLRRGEFRCDAELDLHGLNSQDARQTLVQFLNSAHEQDKRCVRIIHGKGLGSSNQGPVLKGLVNSWLRQRSEVLAFHSCRPIDGGTGAVYVLLKSYRKS